MADSKRFKFVLIAAATACSAAVLGLVIYSGKQPEPPPPGAVESGEQQKRNDSIPIAGPEYSLDKEEREYLWDLEHHTNLLSKFGFSDFIESWRNNDRDTLAAVFDQEFRGAVIDTERPAALSSTNELLNVQRMQPVNGAETILSGLEFADWVLDLRARFADEPAPEGRFDTMKLAPPGPDSEQRRWMAKCQFRVWGQSLSNGPLEITVRIDLVTHDISETRLNEAGWLVSSHVHQVDIAHSDRLIFKDVTNQSGIDTAAMYDNWQSENNLINTGGMYACDFNRDGISDLFMTDFHEDGTQFLVGQADGTFDDQTDRVGLGQVHSPIASFADIDNDGWVDLIVPRDGRVFRNESGKRFREISAQTNLGKLVLGLPAPPRSLSAIVPADFNCDGLIDLYVTRVVPPTGSWLESRQPDMVPNQLLINRGDYRFEDVTRRVNAGGGGLSCFSAVWTDVNHDRWPDIYLINEFGNGTLLVNREGKTFENQLLVEAQNDFGSMGLTCGDINNDGNIDIYVSNMYSKAGSRIMGNMKAESYPEDVRQRLRNMVAGGELYQNLGNLDFTPLGKQFQVNAAGWAWGTALADFNNDGWLDLHVTAGFISRDRQKPDG